MAAASTRTYAADCRTAYRMASVDGLPLGGYSPDTQYPTAGPHLPPAQFWREILRYRLMGECPTGWRVICSIGVPDYPRDLAAARAVADKVGAAYAGSDDALAVCAAVLDLVGWADPDPIGN